MQALTSQRFYFLLFESIQGAFTILWIGLAGLTRNILSTTDLCGENIRFADSHDSN